MPSKHAILSPSSSKRWLTCTPSARLESMMPSRDTIFTQEGTIAHAIAENILNAHIAHNFAAFKPYEELKGYLDEWGESYGLELDDLAQQAAALNLDFKDMAETVSERYARIVFETAMETKSEDPGTELFVEAELKLSEYIPEGFGSSDAVIIGAGKLMVFDLKYGKGVKVEAEGNTQMLCYALGAFLGPGELYHTPFIEMHIVQPRLDHHSIWAIDSLQLVTWADKVLAPAAAKAFVGEGRLEAGEHCKWCRVAAQCPALKAYSTQAVSYTAPELMSKEDVAESLKAIPAIKSWIDSVETWSLDQALAGNEIPGFKVIEGRSIRKISDQQAAIDILKGAGFDESAYLKPRELETITNLQKTLRKKTFEELLGSLVVKPQGKPALVPSDDPRPAFIPDGATAFNNI